MNKKILYATIALAITLTLLSGVYAAVTSLFTTTQTLTVPKYSLTVYQSDGTTVITEAQNVTSLWSWDNVNKQFTLSINIKNTGNVPITPTITIGSISNWALTTSGLGGINVGATLPVIVIMKPTTSVGDETTGLFVLSINKPS